MFNDGKVKFCIIRDKFGKQQATISWLSPTGFIVTDSTMPRIELAQDDESKESPTEEKSPERIASEELYEDIKDAAQFSNSYLALMVLSTSVAAIGLRQSSVAVIIGAMVIAPLLGSSMGVSGLYH